MLKDLYKVNLEADSIEKKFSSGSIYPIEISVLNDLWPSNSDFFYIVVNFNNLFSLRNNDF